MDDTSEQEAMMNNSRLLREMFHLEETGTLKKYATILVEYITKGASILLSALTNNTKKDTDNLNKDQQPNISNIQSSKTESKKSKLVISWKNYRDSTPEQNNSNQNISQQNPTKLPLTQKNDIKQGDKKTPDSSFSDQYDSLKKRVKRDIQDKSSDTCTMAEPKQESYEERRQFQKLQFQSFLMVQNELRKVKRQFESRSEIDKSQQMQKKYQKYIHQNYGSNYNTSNHQQFIQLKNLKRTKESKTDRRPLRKKIHLQDEHQSLYDISKVYTSFQNQKKRREAQKQEEKRLSEERQRKQRLQEQKRIQEKINEERRKIQYQQQLRKKQLKQQQQKRIKNDQILKEQQRLNLTDEQKEQNLNQQKSQQYQANSSQKQDELNLLQTPKKITSNVIKQISPDNTLFPPQVNTGADTKAALPQNKNITFQSPSKPILQTPGSAKKQNPFIKSSPTPGINLQDVINNNTNKSAYLFSATPPVPNNNILNMTTPIANLFTNNTHPQPIFQITKEQGPNYNQNPLQSFNTPFIGAFNSNPTNAIFPSPNPNTSFNSSFNNSSSSSSYYQSPQNIINAPAINNTTNINAINTPVQSVSFTNNENVAKFFENPFMSSPSQPPGLFPSPNESSWSQSQTNRRPRDGTKKPTKPIRIS